METETNKPTKAEITTDEYFGGCPECGRVSAHLNFGRNHYGTCDEHKVYWWFGSNLFSSWRYETEADWQRNGVLLKSYCEVEPLHVTRQRAVELGWAEPVAVAEPEPVTAADPDEIEIPF